MQVKYTGDGRVFVRRSYLEKVQAEIDETLAELPGAVPIDAATLITLELAGYTWDFERGQVVEAEGVEYAHVN
jgi:hypothetical protein